MPKKKTLLKPQPHKISSITRGRLIACLRMNSFQQHSPNAAFVKILCPSHSARAVLRAFCSFVLAIWLGAQSSCVIMPALNDSRVRFANPPRVGSWLPAQRELFACESVDAARYMAETGFYHTQCDQLTEIEQREYRVFSRSKVTLSEGPMWLLEVRRQQSIYWVPIPWHDWA